METMRMMGKKIPYPAEYNLFLKKLLKLVKTKGILVKKMSIGDDFLFSKPTEKYKKHLGAVPVTNLFGNIKHVYLVYEDFDGSIKYYDYPQF